MAMPSVLDKLIESLRVLPGVGPKSAQRMAYHLLQRDQHGAAKLARSLSDALIKLHHCSRCNTFTELTLCELCSNPKREHSQLCVVEMPADLLMVEQTLSYKGLYFVLMGHLSPLDGIGPSDIGFEQLIKRATDGQIKEVILSTNFTVEGEATAHYVAITLRRHGLKVTRIARGLPIGSELAHVDSSTLAQALIERKPF